MREHADHFQPGRSEALTGYLLQVGRASLRRSHLEVVEGLRFEGSIGKSGWEEWRFRSRVPLAGEGFVESDTPYLYRVVCRRSGSRLLMVGNHKKVVEFVLEGASRRKIEAQLDYQPIRVDSLVRHLCANPGRYVLTYAHARVPAFGDSLRSLSFYGGDLAEANFFRDHLRILRFYTCGLRPLEVPSEVVRLGAEGSVSFFFSGLESVRRVQDALAFVSRLDLFGLEVGSPGSDPAADIEE